MADKLSLALMGFIFSSSKRVLKIELNLGDGKPKDRRQDSYRTPKIEKLY